MTAVYNGRLRAVIKRMRIALFCFALLTIAAGSAAARIGETASQCANRYGPPKDTPSSKILDRSSPLLEGAVHHVYEYQGWKIRAAFLQLDGPAVRIDYSKVGPDVLTKDYELQAIMSANTPAGMTWARRASAPCAPNGRATAGECPAQPPPWRRCGH
jgi:hypothetical protein